MLHSLYIKNFVLINEMHLEFFDGFTVITGETGSGKSILLGALNLLLGERANISLIRDQNSKTIVEGVFKINNENLERFFTQNELDYQNETIVRREIHFNGKSRAFINDSPVSLAQLREITSQLVLIHSQHNTINLKDSNYQLELLDVLADTIQDRLLFNQKYENYIDLSNEYKRLKVEYDKSILEIDYINFQINELDKLELFKNDYIEIEKEYNEIDNVEDIKQAYSLIINQLASSHVDGGISDSIQSLRAIIEKYSSLSSDLHLLSQRLKEVGIEIIDIAETAKDKIEELESNPERKLFLIDKLDLFNSSLRKFNVSNQTQLIEKYNEFLSSSNNLVEQEEKIQRIHVALSNLREELIRDADKLHLRRIEKSILIQNEIIYLLEELKLPNCSIKFDLIKTPDFSKNGCSKLQIQFSSNKGMSLSPIEKVASGGELSRVMLAFQYMVSTKKQLPTILFDEIDTGVSGDVAQKIGNVLKGMGEHMQLFAISHLPQVASKGNLHIMVSKNEIENRTETQVRYLNHEDRILEIARLMSGDNITNAAIENAKLLMV